MSTATSTLTRREQLQLHDIGQALLDLATATCARGDIFLAGQLTMCALTITALLRHDNDHAEAPHNG